MDTEPTAPYEEPSELCTQMGYQFSVEGNYEQLSKDLLMLMNISHSSYVDKYRNKSKFNG